MRRKMSKTEFVHRANSIHNYQYDYTKVIYIGANKNVIITCLKHKDFLQRPSHHLDGRICLKCSKEKTVFTTDNFIIKANVIHNNFYNYSKSIYVSSKQKIIIICPIHKEFEQTPTDHLGNHGCYKCGVEKYSSKKRSNIDNFIFKAKLVHEDKFNYSKVNYVGTHSLILIICNLNQHEFNITPNSHLRGTGCARCSGCALTHNDWVKKAINTHGDLYDYSESKYINIKTKIKVICKNKHIFYTNPSDHTGGAGCSICSKNKSPTTDDWIIRAKLVYGDKYNYSKVNYINNSTKVEIICSKHKSFWQNPYSHTSGHECPKCFEFSSKIEKHWIDSLNIPDLERGKNFRIGKRRFIFDGYHGPTNTVYEFNGDFWHGNPAKYKSEGINNLLKVTFKELYDKTMDKEKTLIAHGFKVISIWEHDYRSQIENKRII